MIFCLKILLTSITLCQIIFPATTSNVQETTTEGPTTTVELITTTEPTTTTEGPTTTVELITITERTTTTEGPTTTMELITTTEPTTTNEGPTTTMELITTTEPTTTIEGPTTNVELITTTEPTTTTEGPTTTVELITTTEPTTTTEGQTITEVPMTTMEGPMSTENSITTNEYLSTTTEALNTLSTSPNPQSNETEQSPMSTASTTSDLTTISTVIVCPNETDSSIIWPETPAGGKANVPCSSSSTDFNSGYITRECHEDGRWDSPSYLQCICEGLNTIEAESPDAYDRLFETVKRCFDKNTSNSDQHGGTIQKACDVLDDITDRLDQIQDNKKAKEAAEKILSSVNVILNEDWEKSWEDVNKNSNRSFSSSAADKVMKVVNHVAEKLVDGLPVSGSMAIINDNLVLEISKTESTNESTTKTLPSVEMRKKNPWLRSSATISSDKLLASNSNISVSCTIYRTLNKLISLQKFSIASTDIMSVILYNNSESLSNLTHNSHLIKVTLNFLEETSMIPRFQNYTKVCGWIDHESGTWRNDGCMIKTDVDEQVSCECNHLTEFSIALLQIEDKMALSLMLAAGIIVIILMAIIIILLFSSLYRKTGVLVRASVLHVAFDVMLMNIIYLVLLPDDNLNLTQVECSWLQRLLHFSYFQLFTVLILEELRHLIFCDATSKIAGVLFIFAWIIPVLIILIVSFTNSTTYDGCMPWSFANLLNMPSSVKFGFITPALILALNFVQMSFFNMFRACRSLRFGSPWKSSDWATLRTSTQNTFVILPAIWFTWVVSVHAFYEDRELGNREWFNFFAVTTLIQGLLIFVLNGVTRPEIKNYACSGNTTTSTDQQFELLNMDLNPVSSYSYQTTQEN